MNDFERIVGLVRSYETPLEEVEIPTTTPEERAAGNVRRIGAVLLEGQGFGAYFVMSDAEHEKQNAAFCGILPIANEYVDAEYPITVNGVNGTLRRTVEIHDGAITGLLYNVTHSEVLVS